MKKLTVNSDKRMTVREVAVVKLNLEKNSEVATKPKTDLEKELIIQQALQFQQEKIERLTKALEQERAEKQALIATNQELITEVTHADNHANYMIGLPRWHGEQSMKKRVWLPYKDD